MILIVHRMMEWLYDIPEMNTWLTTTIRKEPLLVACPSKTKAKKQSNI